MFWDKPDYRAEIANLAKQLETVVAEKVAIEKQLEEATDGMESAYSKYEDYKASTSAQLKSAEDLKQVYEAKIEAIKGSVNLKVNSALASVGVNMFANESFSVKNEPSDMECLNTFNSLTGNAKTEYYVKNKDKISRALLK